MCIYACREHFIGHIRPITALSKQRSRQRPRVQYGDFHWPHPRRRMVLTRRRWVVVLWRALTLDMLRARQPGDDPGSSSGAARSSIPCESAYRFHECSTWPPQDLADSVHDTTGSMMQQSIAELMKSFPDGVHAGDVASMMQRPCMQRICVHVQLIHGKLYIVAPPGMKTCIDGASLATRLTCTVSKRSWPDEMINQCLEAERDRNFTRSEYCSDSFRMRQKGVTIPKWWSDWHYPHTLEWNFAAGLNLSSCKAEGPRTPLPGDHNNAFTRLRLQSALRFLMRAYARLHSLGRLTQPLELVLCPNEAPVNLGGWCLTGPQPVFSATSNEEAAVIPFLQWIQGSERDADLAYWKPAPFRGLETGARYAGGGGPVPLSDKFRMQWKTKTSVAVFRGSVHRLSVYSNRWREKGARRTSVTASNWQKLGRMALLAAKVRWPGLLDVRLSGRSVEAREGLQVRLNISNATWARMNGGEYLSLQLQAERYKYALDVEGHGGWADRGYKLLLQDQLVIVQDTPARPWYHRFTRPFVHYLPVDSNLGNLSQAIRWAQENDAAAQSMAARAHLLVHQVLQPGAMFLYAEHVLLEYARLLDYIPTLHERAIRFRCDEHVNPQRQCHRRSAKERITLGETQCAFVIENDGVLPRAPDANYTTLFEASLALQEVADANKKPKGSQLVAKQQGQLPLRGIYTMHSPCAMQSMEGKDGYRRKIDDDAA